MIKECIELLLKILNAFGTSHIEPEIFRLAKFNDDSATSSLWRLLFEVIYFLKYNTIDDICVRAYSQFTPDELSIFVRRELQRCGFFSRDLESLPTDMSTGSRELLLSFGWVLCKESLLQRFMDKCAKPFNEDPPVSYDKTSQDDFPELSSKVVSDDATLSRDKLRQLVWMNGRLRMSLRRLYWLRRETLHKRHNISKATEGVENGHPWRQHLTAMEVAMLRDPDLMRKQLQLLERDNQRLQWLLHWPQVEEQFWRWMESVLDIKLADKQLRYENGAVSSSSLIASETSSISLASETSLGGLTESHKQLHDCLIKYESIAELLEKQISERSINVTAKEVELMIVAVDDEIKKYNVKLDQTLTKGIATSCQPANFVHIPAKNKDIKVTAQIQGTSARPPHRSGLLGNSLQQQQLVNNVELEVARLEAVLAKLESDVESNYADFKNELQNVSAATNVVSLYNN